MRNLLKKALRGLALAALFSVMCLPALRAQQPMPDQLANSAWVGEEQLQGYGRLEFRLHGNGMATMVDTDGASPGTYMARGPHVLLRFHNGGVEYVGELRGTMLVGLARNSDQAWNFAVRRIGMATPTPIPLPNPPTPNPFPNPPVPPSPPTPSVNNPYLQFQQGYLHPQYLPQPQYQQGIRNSGLHLNPQFNPQLRLLTPHMNPQGYPPQQLFQRQNFYPPVNPY